MEVAIEQAMVTAPEAAKASAGVAMERATAAKVRLFMRCGFAFAALLAMCCVLMATQALPTTSEKVPDHRLKWLGPGKGVSVSGDWDRWQRPGIPMERDSQGNFATDIFLPEHCPVNNLVMSGVCCYHYKFFVDYGTHARWQHDPKQPSDKDPDGRVNNFMCKFARTRSGAMQRGATSPLSAKLRERAILRARSSSGQQASSSVAPTADSEATTTRDPSVQSDMPVPAAADATPQCLILPATFFNGSALTATTTRNT